MPETTGQIARPLTTAPVSNHPLMTVSQAAALLGCSGMTIRRRIDARQFPAVKIGTKALIPRAFVEALLDAAADGETVVVEEFLATWTAGTRGGA